MTLLELLGMLIVAGICGGLAQSLVGYSHRGCLTSIVLGFVGAMLGSWLARKLDLPEMLTLKFGDTTYPVVWSVIGATLFVALLAFVTGRRGRPD